MCYAEGKYQTPAHSLMVRFHFWHTFLYYRPVSSLLPATQCYVAQRSYLKCELFKTLSLEKRK